MGSITGRLEIEPTTSPVSSKIASHIPIPSGAETPLVYLAFSVNADATEGAAAFDMGATGNAVTASGGAGYELDLKGYVLTIDAAPAFAISAAAPDKANGTLSVTLANSSAATVAVSYFDANGKFVSAQLQTVAANAGTATLALSADANRARVILLDADCRPLCAWLDATI